MSKLDHSSIYGDTGKRDYSDVPVPEPTKEQVSQSVDPKNKGVSTGIPELDIAIGNIKKQPPGGIKKKTFTVVVADFGVGKSMLMTNIFVNLARQGKKCVIFDLENGVDKVWERLTQIWLRVDDSIFHKNYEEDIWKARQDIGKYIKVYDHAFIEENLLGGDIKDFIKGKIELHTKTGSEYFLVDPLIALETSSASNRYDEQGDLVQMLKNQTQALDISTFLCHHLKKPDRKSKFVTSEDEAVAVQQEYVVPTKHNFLGSSKIGALTTDMWGFMRFYNDSDPVRRATCIFNVLKTRSTELRHTRLYLDPDTLIVSDNILDVSYLRNKSNPPKSVVNRTQSSLQDPEKKPVQKNGLAPQNPKTKSEVKQAEQHRKAVKEIWNTDWIDEGLKTPLREAPA